ncbi:MAG TPA: MFS transporter, partial [Kiloniellaceae bacterium]|nr:MFS transporter [Kiloniellaceae bacterium]
IVLPPLFPLLTGELGVNYLKLGVLLTVANVTTSLCQVPIGFLVDRLGPRPILVAGLASMGGAVVLAGLAPSYEVLLVAMVLLGLGNSVFHPADYAVMASKISADRLGRAFSLHTFAGHLGWAVAPTTIIALTALFSWRWALILAGLTGCAAALFIWWRGAILTIGPAAGGAPLRSAASTTASAAPARRKPGFLLLFSGPMLLLFLYMVFSSVATSGLNGFTVSALVSGYGQPLTGANLVLTLFLVAGAVGVLLGGQLADWTDRHELVLAVCFLVGSAVLCLAGWVFTSFLSLAAAVTFAGLVLGAIRPSRDMMVRKAAPAGSYGKVFGFVTMGMNLGGAMAPLLFGWVIDQDGGALIFLLAAAAMLLSLAAALLANTALVRAASRRACGPTTAESQ